MRFLSAIGSLAVVVIAASVIWRLVSKHRQTPCPAWLLPLLENPYVEALAGARTLLERAAVEPGMRVLDVGSGPGRLTLPLAERVGAGGSVVALDLQPAMVERLAARLAEAGIENVVPVVGGVGEGRLGSGGFDRAFLVTVLGEIVDKRRALEEVRDLLEPDGVLSITEVFPDPHYQSRKAVHGLAESAGFRLQDSFGSWLTFTLNFRKQRASPAERSAASKPGSGQTPP